MTFDEREDSPASGVKMEVSPTEHAAAARFTFPADAAYRNLIFDCEFADGGLSFDPETNSFTAYSDHVKDGSTRMYVYGVFNTPCETAQVVGKKQGIVGFSGDTPVVSPEQAKKNLELERF